MALRSFVVRINLNGEPLDMSISEFLAHLARMDDDSKKVKEAIYFILNLREELSMLVASEYHFPNCMRFLKDAIATVENEKLKCSERARENEGKLHETSLDRVRGRVFINNENKNMHEGQADNVSDESFIENEVPSDVQDGMLLWPEQLGQPETIGPDPNFVREVTRRQRMVWSVDLHRKFRFAVEALGGPREAKPKQIHDLLKVDGLTTEQIKSHLQRYRKHLNSRCQLGSALGSGQTALTANSTLVRTRFSLLCMQPGESSNDHKTRAPNKKME